MRCIYFFLLTLSSTYTGLAQEPAFQDGEWFQFRIHYGLINAGYADLSVNNATIQNKPVYHVKGYGYTTGLSRFFFKVEDRYETYVDKKTILPYRFVRNINEGGYTKDKIIDFDHELNQALVFDRKHNKKSTHKTEPSVHDMVSSFYYLRDRLNTTNLKEGDELSLNMFFDEENFKFKLKYLGKEEITTKFGKIKSLVFRPYVQSGRVFKEQESLTIWISDDKNKIPLRIKADLAVGSLKADIEAFKGLKHPFYIVQN